MIDWVHEKRDFVDVALWEDAGVDTLPFTLIANNNHPVIFFDEKSMFVNSKDSDGLYD